MYEDSPISIEIRLMAFQWWYTSTGNAPEWVLDTLQSCPKFNTRKEAYAWFGTEIAAMMGYFSGSVCTSLGDVFRINFGFCEITVELKLVSK